MYQKLLLTLSIALASALSWADTITINQVEIEYERKGTGEHIVLFEAGAISGMAGWDTIWNNLPTNVTALRYSRRGEGGSSPCTGDLTAKDYVKDTEQLIQQLNINKPFIHVSHSYGSKVAREYAAKNQEQILAMLFVDPINPRDVEIIEKLDPINGQAANDKLQKQDIAAGKENNWCLIKDIWHKQPSKGYGEIKDIPITLIAGVKKFAQPTRLFDTDEARDLWGQYQSEWVLQFPQGKAVMANNSGHFVQDDEPELVLAELQALILRIETH